MFGCRGEAETTKAMTSICRSFVSTERDFVRGTGNVFDTASLAQTPLSDDGALRKPALGLSSTDTYLKGGGTAWVPVEWNEGGQGPVASGGKAVAMPHEATLRGAEACEASDDERVCVPRHEPRCAVDARCLERAGGRLRERLHRG